MNSVSDFAKFAAGKYLQSAVFIDDEIYSKHSGKPREEEGGFPLRQRKPAFFPPAKAAPKTPDVEKEPIGVLGSSAFHPKDIVSSFAKQGIVCALYEPDQDFLTNEGSEIFKLCEAADLVILDWDFHADDGRRMRALIAALVAQSGRSLPHHSRLVVIYTSTPSLQKVSSSLFEELKQAGTSPQSVDETDLRLDVGSTRIVVLGKADGGRIGVEAGFSINEGQLASRVIDEFVLKNRGILTTYVLLGMSAIKQNSRRVLAKFDSHMDGAFLLHRGLLLHVEEAFESLPALISDEFSAIIEDALLGIDGISSIVKDRVSQLDVTAPSVPWRKEELISDGDQRGKRIEKELEQIEFQKLTECLLIGGIHMLKDHRNCKEVRELTEDFKSVSRNLKPSVMATLRQAVESVDKKSNERLAALFNSRTFYDQGTRHMTLGTIIRQSRDDAMSYSICLIPLCDSVRLKSDSHTFPFLRLTEGGLGSRGGTGFIVEDSGGNLVSLLASGKIKDLWIESFDVVDQSGVVAAKLESGAFWYSSTAGIKYEWVGQLKTAHAQRVGHVLSQALSRVGLSEAEWVRLLCNKTIG